MKSYDKKAALAWISSVVISFILVGILYGAKAFKSVDPQTQKVVVEPIPTWTVGFLPTIVVSIVLALIYSNTH